jgi:hypothetical protein
MKFAAEIKSPGIKNAGCGEDKNRAEHEHYSALPQAAQAASPSFTSSETGQWSVGTHEDGRHRTT